jgi:putative transposase
MARPLRIVYPGAYYHVMSRGNEQKEIFKSQRDREKFLEYLASANERYGAIIQAYCLMSNHYHLLLETPEGNLPQIMRHINGAYTTYFNLKRKRSGHLFQGRYKAILVEADSYAAELSRYIHLNPIRVGLAERPEDYPWSSYRSYIGQSPPADWLKTEFILSYFGQPGTKTRIRYRKFVEELQDRDYDSPLRKAIGAAVLGSADFVERVTANHLDDREHEKDLPALRQLISKPSPEQILKAIENDFATNNKLARQVGMYLCHRYSGKKIREIGELFGVGSSAVTEASRRLQERIEGDSKLKEAIQGVKIKLKI